MRKRFVRRVLAGAVLSGTAPFAAPLAGPSEFGAVMRFTFDETIRPWMSAPVVIETLRAQNANHAGLDAAQKAALQQSWQAERAEGAGPLVREVLDNTLAAFLKDKAEDAGLPEIIIADGTGLTIAANRTVATYAVGGEAAWQATVPVGSTATHAGEAAFDEASGRFLAPFSATIADPETGRPIGVITVGFDVEALL